jgi:hypothetical protein
VKAVKRSQAGIEDGVARFNGMDGWRQGRHGN